MYLSKVQKYGKNNNLIFSGIQWRPSTPFKVWKTGYNTFSLCFYKLFSLSLFCDILYFLQLCPCFLYSSVFLLSVFVHICCIFCYPLLLVICICDPPTWRGGGEKVVLTEKVQSSLFLFTFSLKYLSLSWKLKSWRKAWNAKPKYNYCVFF